MEVLRWRCGQSSQGQMNFSGAVADSSSRMRSLFWRGVTIMAMSTAPLFVLPHEAMAATVLPGQSIQSAIDLAQVGDVISLGAGTYSGNLTLRSGVHLVGNGANTVIDGVITVPASADGVNIAGLTANGFSLYGTHLTLNQVVSLGTVQSGGDAGALLVDSTVKGYLAVDGNSLMRLEQTRLEQTAFVRDTGRAELLQPECLSYLEIQGNAVATVSGGQLNGAFISGTAQLSLAGVTSGGNLGLKGQGQLVAEDSTLNLITWEDEGFASLTRVNLNSAAIKVASGLSVLAEEIGPGTIAAGAISAGSSPFGTSLVDVTVGTVSYDISGELLAQGGGLNGYSYVRSTGRAQFEAYDYAQYSIVEGSGLVHFVDSQLRADLIARDSATLTFTGTESLGGAVQLEGAASARVEGGSQLGQVRVRAQSQLNVVDATVHKLILTVEAGRSLVLDGLHPGLLSGEVGTPGALGGPALSFIAGTVDSLQLWVQGEANVLNTTVDDYLVVEGGGQAQLENARMQSVGVVRGSGNLSCLDCVAGPFFFAEGQATAHFTGGELQNYAELREQAQAFFQQTVLNANLEATAHAVATLQGVSSTSYTLKVRGDSQVSVSQDSTLYGLTVAEHGRLTITGGQVQIFTVDVAAGDDVAISGLKPGLQTGFFGPMVQGPQAQLTGTSLATTSLLVHGQASVQDSQWNGYAFAYENASTQVENTDFLGVTYLLAGSHNSLVGGKVENLFNVQGAITRFDGVRFAAGAAPYFGGSSQNTFQRCIFEKALTLSEASVNDLGLLGGVNASVGENDFSLIISDLKLINNTANPVNAQNNVWGSEVSTEIAAHIYDQADDALLGPVNFEPFKRKNLPPTVSAGDPLTISSFDQELTVLVGLAADPEAEFMSYRWLEGSLVLLDDTPVAPDGSTPLNLAQVPFLGAGDHALTLEVTDAYGYVVTAQTVLTIGNSAPVVTALGGGVFVEGDAISLEGELSDYDGDLVTYTWYLGSTALSVGAIATVVEGEVVGIPALTLPTGLPVGVHSLVLEATDGVNPGVSAVVTVEVQASAPPTLAPVANPSLLWPPNEQLRPVVIDTFAMDAQGGAVKLSAWVSSNEPRWQARFGQKDWTTPVINDSTGAISLKLRAEANIGMQPRIYTIWITATDKNGKSSTAQATVKVTHARGCSGH